eukprot:764140-Hanusia_phi.AAC.1
MRTEFNRSGRPGRARRITPGPVTRRGTPVGLDTIAAGSGTRDRRDRRAVGAEALPVPGPDGPPAEWHVPMSDSVAATAAGRSFNGGTTHGESQSQIGDNANERTEMMPRHRRARRGPAARRTAPGPV